MKKLIETVKKVKRGYWLVLFLFLTAFSINGDELLEIKKGLEIFGAIYRQVNRNYVESVDPEDLLQHSIKAMLEHLDPYTEYIPENEIEDFRQRYVKTQYSGIGARVILSDSGQVFIAEVFENGPAHQAGLSVGDEILAVDGRPLNTKEADEVSHLMKGISGTPVIVTVRKVENGVIDDRHIIRSEISQSNVSYATVFHGGVGYIKLDRFLADAADEVEKNLAMLEKKESLSGLILDLRDNGGGILQESVKIINLFVPKGVEVVKQSNERTHETISYITKRLPLVPDLPLVVLINENSASASEIVAGALQDLDRAVIVGQRSFGKGLVQQTFRLPYNNMVKITVAKYYTPSGRCIQALDYTHKDVDGQISKIDESLITAYKTRNGRSVYNGSGIFPDIWLEQNQKHELVDEVNRKLLVFKYANDFRKHHPRIANPSSFRLGDSTLQEFMSYLRRYPFDYRPITSKLIDQLDAAVDASGNEKLVDNEINALRLKLNKGIDQELKEQKEALKADLEEEIVSRYYFQRGKQAYRCIRDEQIAKAREMLSVDKRMVYHDILQGIGTYGSIGDPLPLVTNRHSYTQR